MNKYLMKYFEKASFKSDISNKLVKMFVAIKLDIKNSTRDTCVFNFLFASQQYLVFSVVVRERACREPTRCTIGN